MKKIKKLLSLNNEIIQIKKDIERQYEVIGLTYENLNNLTNYFTLKEYSQILSYMQEVLENTLKQQEKLENELKQNCQHEALYNLKSKNETKKFKCLLCGEEFECLKMESMNGKQEYYFQDGNKFLEARRLYLQLFLELDLLPNTKIKTKNK